MNLLKLFDVVPNPWHDLFAYSAMLLTVAGTVLLTIRGGDVAWWPGLAALAAVVLVIVGFLRGQRAADDTAPTGRSFRFIWFSAGLLLALGGLLMRGNATPVEWLLTALPFFLAALYSASLTSKDSISLWLFPFLLASAVLGTSALLGAVSIGAFPAIFAFFLGVVIKAMRDLELKMSGTTGEDAAMQKLAHRRLNWISVVVFIFGVISLWPWLGKLYGLAYLWILIIGVLVPMMSLWGRLRQPRRDNLLTALVRFNRVLPYASLILLFAFVVG